MDEIITSRDYFHKLQIKYFTNYNHFQTYFINLFVNNVACTYCCYFRSSDKGYLLNQKNNNTEPIKKSYYNKHRNKLKKLEIILKEYGEN